MSKTEQDAVNIRRMTNDDIHAVLALDWRAEGGRSLLSYKDIVALNLGGSLDVSFVAEVGGKVIGFVITRLAYLMIPFTEVCIVQGMLVEPDYQRRHIGTKLFEKLLEHCHSQGINTIRTLVEERNEELRQFVERLGFRRSHIVNYDRTFER
jgi:ribosomal protein S18 acetylase RimI-like enzyme